MNPDLDKIRALLNSPEGHELRDYLSSELASLRNIDTIAETEHPYAKAVQFEGQRMAFKKLARILARLAIFADEPMPVRDPRDSFHMGE